MAGQDEAKTTQSQNQSQTQQQQQQQTQQQQQETAQQQAQNTAQQQNTSGTTLQDQTQSSTKSPWAAAEPLLQGLLSKYGGLSTGVTSGQSSALSNLNNAASSVPNFGSAATGAVSNLFNSSTEPQVGMLKNAYGTLQSNLGSVASGAGLDPYSTPGFSDALSTMTSDITNKIKGVYAGSGRDPSGAGSFSGSLGRGLTEGLSPLLMDQYNKNAARMDAANTSLFGAAGSTASGITEQQQVPLTNAASAIGLVPSASSAFTLPAETQLSAADAEYSQPWTNLASALTPATSLGGLGSQTSGAGTIAGSNTGLTSGTGSTTGTSSGTTSGSGTGTSSGTSSGTSVGTGTSNTIQPQSTLSNILGGTLGGAGILSSLGGAGGGLGALSSLFALSDERAKTDVEPVGKLNDGQDVFRYRYKGSPTTQIGLLAQQVAKTAPDAVGEFGDTGMLGVNYRRATDRAASFGRKAA